MLERPWKDGHGLLREANERDLEEHAWQLWVTTLPYTAEDKRKGFADFLAEIKAKAKAKLNSKKSTVEIMALATEIMARDR